MVVIRGRVIWPVIGISLAFGRSSEDERGSSWALHTKEFISKDGEESYINFPREMKGRVLVGEKKV